MSWSDNYIGLPWREHGRSREGVDCYGLLRLIYEEQLSIRLPAYTMYQSVECRREIALLIEGLSTNWYQVDQPKPFDAVLFRIGLYPSHLGVVVKQPLFIHQPEKGESVIARWTSPEWTNRVAGFYRLAR